MNNEIEAILTKIDGLFEELVNLRLTDSRYPNYDEIETDSLGELIDKLLIVHVRYWYLEDQMSGELEDNKLAELRRKSESLFKEKRPMLVQAIDKAIVSRIINGTFEISESVKLYRGWN